MQLVSPQSLANPAQAQRRWRIAGQIRIANRPASPWIAADWISSAGRA